MTSVDINKWISGEIEAFFDPPTMPPLVATDRNPVEERSTTRPSVRKFRYPAITAVIVAFAFVVVAIFAVSMRYAVGPSVATNAMSRPSESRITSTGTEEAASFTPAAPTPKEAAPAPKEAAPAPKEAPTPKEAAPTPKEIAPIVAPPVLSQPATRADPQRAVSLSDFGVGYDHRTKAASIPQRKPSPAKRISSRHWPRYTSPVPAESGEATRLMVDELRQRGVAVDTAFGSGYPK
jgi:hypothetical protein